MTVIPFLLRFDVTRTSRSLFARSFALQKAARALEKGHTSRSNAKSSHRQKQRVSRRGKRNPASLS
jgi:hypothetical protein